MEHIVQFGITIDDNAIKKNIEANAMDAVVNQFVREMKSNLPKRYGKIDWSRVAYDCIRDFIEENRQEVIELAAKMMVDHVKRTKKWKEKYAEITEEN